MSEEDRLQLENECLMKYSKAQMIQKYIDELDESSKLSELWCKSQEENRELQQRIDKAIEYIKTTNILGLRYGKTIFSIYLTKLLEILRGGGNNE